MTTTREPTSGRYLSEMVANDLCEHLEVCRIRVRHPRSTKRETALLGDRLHLDVEVVQDLEVVGHESGRAHDDGASAARGGLLDHRSDRRTPPRVVRPPSGLPPDREVVQAQTLGDEPRRLSQPVAVATARFAVARLATER